MAITVRRLRLADYEAMIEVFEVCGLHPRTRSRDSRKAIARQLRSNRTLYFGAFDGRRLVGTVLGTHDTRKGWINRLAVLPDYRHRGIASKLVHTCERALRTAGMEMFAALIEGDNVASQDLFARLGYETSDIRYYRRKLRDDV